MILLLKTQIGNGNLYLSKRQIARNEIAVRRITTIISVTCVKKNSQIGTLIKIIIIGKISTFQEIALDLIYSQKL